MNISSLMQYVSRQIHTIVRRYDSYSVLIDEVCVRKDLEDSPGPLGNHDSRLIQFLLAQAAVEHPKIFTDSDNVAYSTVPSQEGLFLIGPVFLTGNAQSKYYLPQQEYSPQWLSSLYRCDTEELVKLLLLVYNLFHENILSIDEALSANYLKNSDKQQVLENFSGIVFERIESSTRHNPYDQEVREMASIRNGDLEQLQKSWEEDYVGEVGILAKNKLRNFKNIAIILVTLSSRAAIEGGIHPETAYSLSDSYIQKIEDVTSPETAIHLGRQAEYQYAALVYELKHNKAAAQESANHHISRCKDYIFAHLHGKIRISDMSKDLFLNPNYLSNLFKKEEGITVTEYIWNEKLKLVQNMLVYSRYSFNDIAAYLGFCSQSHLGKQFKAATGMTLREYRELYGVRNFQIFK